MNVMKQAHAKTKAKIAARIWFPGAPSYASLFKYFLAVAHSEYKAARLAAKGQIDYVSANTHDLQEGDVVMHYGCVFVLKNRKVLPLTSKECPDRQGNCVTFDSDYIGAVSGNETFPKHWRDNYRFQGNKLATWCKVVAA